MKMHLLNVSILAVFIIVITSCDPLPKSPTPQGIITLTAIPTMAPTNIPTMTLPPEPTATQRSAISTTYKDETNGFQLDYPGDWTLIPFKQIGSRGGQVQLFSPGTTADTLLTGGTRISITVFKWDPKNDLAAFVTQRKIAWNASGQRILEEGEGRLADGRREMHFIIENQEKDQTFLLYTITGENYLQIAGDGDLALIEEIARSIRPLVLLK